MNYSLLAQQLCSLLIGLGGAFLAMMAIVTTLPQKEHGLAGQMKAFARRDFLASASSLVLCALAGVVCMSSVSAEFLPIGSETEVFFHVACVFIYLCCFGLLECFNSLGLILTVDDEDDIVRPRVTERSETFRLGSLLRGETNIVDLWQLREAHSAAALALRLFLLVSCLFAVGTSWRFGQVDGFGSRLPFQLFVMGPILLSGSAFLVTTSRRKRLANMEVSPIPPTVSLQAISTSTVLALFFHSWFVPALPVWLIVSLCLTLVLFTAASTHFTMGRPMLYARLIWSENPPNRKNKQK